MSRKRKEETGADEEQQLFYNREGEEPPITSSGDILAMMVRGNAESPEMGHPVSTSTDEERNIEKREETRRKPIVSIHGEDVREEPEDRSAA